MKKTPFDFGFVNWLREFFRADDLDDVEEQIERAEKDREFNERDLQSDSESAKAALVVIMDHFAMPVITLHRDTIAEARQKHMVVTTDGDMVKFKITEETA